MQYFHCQHLLLKRDSSFISIVQKHFISLRQTCLTSDYHANVMKVPLPIHVVIYVQVKMSYLITFCLFFYHKTNSEPPMRTVTIFVICLILFYFFFKFAISVHINLPHTRGSRTFILFIANKTLFTAGGPVCTEQVTSAEPKSSLTHILVVVMMASTFSSLLVLNSGHQSQT